MPYDIAQIRWSDDATFARPVKDEEGYRLPVKISEFDGDLVLNTSISETLEVDSTSLAGAITASTTDLAPLLTAILVELRVITACLQQGLNVQDEATAYRTDPTFAEF